MNSLKRHRGLWLLAAACWMGMLSPAVQGGIPGLEGSSFRLTAKHGHIYGGDGNAIHVWGYANQATGRMQYPGPTLILQQGATVSITLRNMLPVPCSIVFPGMEGVTASGGNAGLLAREAPPDNGATAVTYTFTAARPGTFVYHSGTQPDLQVDMGLVGAIIIRPTGFDMMMPRAYAHMDSMYDREFLFLLSEMHLQTHRLVEFGQMASVDTSKCFPNYWFINGRNAPDTMLEPAVPWMPAQPYNCLPMMHPGDKVLMRIIGGGRQSHPFHTHGNHMKVIAVDGRLLESTPGAGADLSQHRFTVASTPGQTVDTIFTWTGEGLGWDIYGHAPGDPLEPNEYAPDHGKPIPVVLPEPLALTFGGMYSGTPFLGTFGNLPPGQGTGNTDAEYVHMWHSHTEKELTNNDVFPGGLMTMLMIMPPWVPIAGH